MKPDSPTHNENASGVVGYYTYGEGAKYLSPAHLPVRHPELVDAHESMHRYLAFNNFTDGIGRIYSNVLSWHEAELQFMHRRGVQQLLAAISDNTLAVHETVATYLGFLLFSVQHAAEVPELRRTLPAMYSELLVGAERAFGAIADPRTLQNAERITTSLFAAAIASLNLSYEVAMLRFDELGRCREFLVRHSPDNRFRRILAQIKPSWDASGLLWRMNDLRADTDEQKLVYQGALFDLIRGSLPDIVFCSQMERPDLFREMVEEVFRDGAQFGYQLTKQIVQPPTPDTVVDVVSSKSNKAAPSEVSSRITLIM